MKKNVITNNLALKILAVISAVLLWVIVINISDPVSDTTISGVPVSILNADEITSQGKVYEVLSGSDTITVSLSAKRSILSAIEKDDIRATADINDLNEEDGTIKIKVETTKYNDKIETLKAKTEYVLIKIENLMKKQIVVTADILGEPAEGYVVGDIVLDQNVVRLSGPESVIEKISSAVIEVSVDDMSNSISTTEDIRLLDKEGLVVSDDRITKNIAAVSINAELLPSKTVSLSVSTVGTPAEGYGLTGIITATPATVLVAAKNNVLKKLTKIEIPSTAISIAGQSSNVTAIIDMNEYLPEGVKLADPEFDGKVSVVVGIGKEEFTSVSFAASKIQIAGLPEGYRAEVLTTSGTVLVGVSGMADSIAKMKVENMAAEVDFDAYMEENEIATLKEAIYEVPLDVTTTDGVKTVTEAKVRVKITKE